MSDVRCQMSDVRCQMSDVRNQKTTSREAAKKKPPTCPLFKGGGRRSRRGFVAGGTPALQISSFFALSRKLFFALYAFFAVKCSFFSVKCFG